MKLGKLQDLYRRLDFVSFLKFAIADAARRIFMPDARFYFAQGGEDVHMLYLLNYKPVGFYLDIGSNQPVKYSNTFKLYMQGWTGVLVDANPGLIEKSRKIRRQDICVHALVSNENRDMDFYISNLDLFSSIHTENAVVGDKQNAELEKINLRTLSIDQIIEKYVPSDTVIDLLSIDVEGHDFQVLQSVSLFKYRPRMIVVEDLYQKKNEMETNQYAQYLAAFRYTLISTDKQNLYFMKNEEFE